MFVSEQLYDSIREACSLLLSPCVKDATVEMHFPIMFEITVSLNSPHGLISFAAPKYCNLAVLAYGYRSNFSSSEQLSSSPSKALEDRTNVTSADRDSSTSSSPAPRTNLKSSDQSSPALINNSRDSGQSSESVENARPDDAMMRSNGQVVERNGDNHGMVKRDDTLVAESPRKTAEDKKSANDSGVTLDDDDAFALEGGPDVPELSSMPRVRINVEPCEPCPQREEEAGVVVRRKKVSDLCQLSSLPFVVMF